MAGEANVVTPVTPRGLLDIYRTLHEHEVHIKDLLSMLKGGNKSPREILRVVQGLEDRMGDRISALDARLVNLEKSGPQQLDSLHVAQGLEDQILDQTALQDACPTYCENSGPPKLDDTVVDQGESLHQGREEKENAKVAQTEVASFGGMKQRIEMHTGLDDQMHDQTTLQDARLVHFDNSGPPKLDDTVVDQGESLHQGRGEKENAKVAKTEVASVTISKTREYLQTIEAREQQLEKKAEELEEKEKTLREKVHNVEMWVGHHDLTVESVTDPVHATTTYLKKFQFHRDYTWETSVFDAMFLIFTSFTTGRETALITLGYVWNLFMVAMTILVISSDEFVDDSIYDRAPIQNWRDREAHMIHYSDPRSQMTLATRVCGKDRGLSMALYQRDLYQEAEKYLQSGGYLLCIVAVSLWISCCLAECRQALNFLVAIAHLPKGSETHLKASADGLEFLSVPKWRYLLGFFVATVRIVIAIALLIYGSLWLTHTISMENLLLNASALSFVLEVDETIFAALAPLRVISLLNAMQPLKLPSSILFKNLPFILFALLVSLVILQYVFFVETTVDFVRDVISIVCEPEGTQKYVMTWSALGWIMYSKNTQSWSDEIATVQPQQNIMSSLLKGGELSQYAVEVKEVEHVENAFRSSLAEFVDQFDCRDYNLVAANAGVGKRLWAVTGNASLHGLDDCHEAQAKGYCLDLSIVGINVRFMCAQTCGCSDMHAGLWDIATPVFGCPQKECKKRLLHKLHNPRTQCVDQGATALKKTGWAWMVDRMRVTENISQAIHSNLMTLGCEALQNLEERIKSQLCSIRVTEIIRESGTNHGAAPFCPISCGCVHQQCNGLCPLSCCHSSEK